MTKIISILGGKGGIGKTNVAINLGAALNEAGKETIVVDGNLTTPNIGIYLGLPVVPVNLHHVLQKKNHVSEAVYLHPSGLKVVIGDISTAQLKNIDPLKLSKVMIDLEGLADYVLVDAAAGLGGEALAAIKASDKVLIITNPEMPAVTDALKTIQIVKDLKKQILGVVLARVRNDGLDMGLKEIEEMLEFPILGIVPESKEIRRSMLLKNPVLISSPDSEASTAYRRLAAKLTGQRYKEKIEGRETFFKKLWKVFGF